MQGEKKCKFLIVEDSQADRFLIKKMLSDTGQDTKVFEASSIEEGININSLHKPDCVILDYFLPDGTADDFLNHKKNESKIPTIILTENPDINNALGTINLGAVNYYNKASINGETLLTAAQNAIAKRQQEKLEETEKLLKLEQSRRDCLNIFASGLAHEINNPLQILLGSTESLKTLSLNSDKMEGHCSSIVVSAERIAKIVKKLQKYVKGMEQNLETDLNATEFSAHLKEYLKLNFSEVDLNKISYTVRDSGTTHKVPVFQLMEICLQYVENALEATKNTDKAHIHFNIIWKEEEIEIVVDDNGPGIDKEISKKIFNPFFTTKTKDKPGLGLALVERTAESINGKVFVRKTQNPFSIGVSLEMKSNGDTVVS